MKSVDKRINCSFLMHKSTPKCTYLPWNSRGRGSESCLDHFHSGILSRHFDKNIVIQMNANPAKHRLYTDLIMEVSTMYDTKNNELNSIVLSLHASLPNTRVKGWNPSTLMEYKRVETIDSRWLLLLRRPNGSPNLIGYFWPRDMNIVREFEWFSEKQIFSFLKIAKKVK